jgi:selenium metabolism protein YedF
MIFLKLTSAASTLALVASLGLSTGAQAASLLYEETHDYGIGQYDPSGDDVLGEKLLISYLKTLKEMGPDLWRLVFINGGVKLTVTDSPVLDELQVYEKNGLLILACGTCLEHFNLTAKKQVGQTTNMLDIVTAMQLADSVITLG